MNARRFALVVPRCPLPLPTPPGEDYFLDPARLMRDAGFSVEILAGRAAGESTHQTIEDISVRRFDSAIPWLRAIATGQYHLLHAHSQLRPALFAGVCGRGAKSVFTSHTFVLPASAWKRRLLIALMNRFDRVIAFTPYEKDVFAQAGVATSKLVVLPLGIDVDFFAHGGDPVRFRDRWKLDAQAPLVLFVSNLQRRKNLDVIFRALALVLASVPGARLIVAGKDLLPSQGEAPACEWARQAGVDSSVVFTDWLPPEALRDAMKAASVVINSSGHRSHENFPLAILEAAAARCSLCVPTLGSLQSVFGSNALYHEPADSEMLAAHILRYLHEPALREVHGRANQARVKDFDVGATRQRLRDLYGSLSTGL